MTFPNKVCTQEESESVTKARTEQVYNYPEKVMSNRKRKPTASAKMIFLKLMFVNWNILSPFQQVSLDYYSKEVNEFQEKVKSETQFELVHKIKFT